MLNKLSELVVASMEETEANRKRFRQGETTDNANYLALVSFVFNRFADAPTVSPDLKG
jgi:hypothetical protein